jgi:hypothetical protein
MRRPKAFLLVLGLAATVINCQDAPNNITNPRPRPGSASAVSAIPPDGVESSLYAQENLTEDYRYAGWLMRDIVLVRFELASSQEQRQAAVDSVAGTQVGGRIFGEDGDGLYLIRLPTDTTNNRLFAAVAKLKGIDGVRWATPNVVYLDGTTYLRSYDGPAMRPSDWHLNPDSAFGHPNRLTWALEAVNAPLAWGCSTGDTTRVAVIDMGIHRDGDIVPNIAPNIPPFPADNFSHGTTVASVLAAHGNDSVGMTGIMWTARLELRDVSQRNPDGTPVTVADSLGNVSQMWSYDLFFQSILRALNNHARVINISLGQNGIHAGPHTAAQDLVRWGVGHTVADEMRSRPAADHPLWVISAGNMESTGDTYWAAFTAIGDSLPTETLVVTGAGSTRGTLSPGATGLGNISIAAPGEAVAVMDASGVHQGDGTSFATPLVSGAAGLLFGFNPNLTASEVRGFLVQGALDGGRVAGPYPFLDAYASLRRAGRRLGGPLCGGIITMENGSLIAYRDSTPREVLASVYPTATYVEIAATHGGRAIHFDRGFFDDGWIVWMGGSTWGSAASPNGRDDYYIGSLMSGYGNNHDDDAALSGFCDETTCTIIRNFAGGDSSRTVGTIPASGSELLTTYPMIGDTALVILNTKVGTDHGSDSYTSARVYKISLVTGGSALYWQESGRGIVTVSFSEDNKAMLIATTTELSLDNSVSTPCTLEYRRTNAARTAIIPPITVGVQCRAGTTPGMPAGTRMLPAWASATWRANVGSRVARNNKLRRSH